MLGCEQGLCLEGTKRSDKLSRGALSWHGGRGCLSLLGLPQLRTRDWAA